MQHLQVFVLSFYYFTTFMIIIIKIIKYSKKGCRWIQILNISIVDMVHITNFKIAIFIIFLNIHNLTFSPKSNMPGLLASKFSRPQLALSRARGNAQLNYNLLE